VKGLKKRKTTGGQKGTLYVHVMEAMDLIPGEWDVFCTVQIKDRMLSTPTVHVSSSDAKWGCVLEFEVIGPNYQFMLECWDKKKDKLLGKYDGNFGNVVDGKSHTTDETYSMASTESGLIRIKLAYKD